MGTLTSHRMGYGFRADCIGFIDSDNIKPFYIPHIFYSAGLVVCSLFRSAEALAVLLALLLWQSRDRMVCPYAVPWVEKKFAVYPPDWLTPATGTVQTPRQNSPATGLLGWSGVQ